MRVMRLGLRDFIALIILAAYLAGIILMGIKCKGFMDYLVPEIQGFIQNLKGAA